MIKSLFSLEEKTAIITGAAGYFGSSFSNCLLSCGASVILIGRGEKTLKLKQSLESKYGSKVKHYLVDFYDTKSYIDTLEEIVKKDYKIDVLINNSFDFSKETGFNDPSGRMERMSKIQWMSSLESGIYWHALAIQYIGEIMKSRNTGSIINVSSMYGVVAPDPYLYEDTDLFNPPSYGTAKAGLLALTRYTASFYGKYNIRCNALVPGSFPNMNQEAYNAPADDKFIEKLKNKTIFHRLGKVEDLLGALIFLASDSSSYMTGQSIVIDGGWVIK
ncbi:MAG: SDR family oxidoreductase [Bacteroidetes bacterium]|nr:SDR family oxidoreductase [Bacteroidota bacterium]